MAVSGQSWTDVSNPKFADAELAANFKTGNYWLKAGKCPDEVVSTLSSLTKVSSENRLRRGGGREREKEEGADSS